MNKIIINALLSNSSNLGFNWIYNDKFLKEYSKTNDMLMTIPNDLIYENNKPSYNTYPNSELGSLTFQGEILKWLYNNWKDNELFNNVRYEKLLLNNLMPGGTYTGYVESFGKKLVLKHLAKDLKYKEEVILDDDQLVGFVPYIAAKALNKSNDEALKLAKVLTNNNDYEHFYLAFDELLKEGSKEILINNALKYVPSNYLNDINKALNSSDDSFITDVHQRSCSIDNALPIVFYLYNKYDSLIDALKENVIIGGASSDRALLLGLLIKNKDLKEEWLTLLK